MLPPIVMAADLLGRSREGAWIEIPVVFFRIYRAVGRSREGAWIEIDKLNEIWSNGQVAPARERGLK